MNTMGHKYQIARSANAAAGRETAESLRENSNEISPATVLAVQGPRAREYGGQPGPEPTRYGDWEKNGRVSDF
ncbi:MAG: succinate dehydrogenase assembly factor 4 [Granulosicoccus sp.]